MAGWCEIDGSNYYGYGPGSSVTFDNCRAPDTMAGTPFFTPASTPANNGGARILVQNGTTQVHLGDGGGVDAIGFNIADARCISDGQTIIKFSTGDVRPVKVVNGRFTYGFSPDNGYTGPLTVAPLGGANLKGDRVRIDQPTAGGYSEYICVADGTSGDSYVGTWKGVGLVQS
jgi:hypothetical protein